MIILNSNTNFTVIYFCEDEDLSDVQETINYLSAKFIDYKFIRGDNTLADWEQLLLMSCCHYNIIANSSFSLWASYLNENKIKPAGQPKIEIKSSGEGKDLEYTISVEKVPEIKKIELEKISLTDYKLKIEKKDLDDRINLLAEGQKKYVNKNIKINNSGISFLSKHNSIYSYNYIY